MNSEPNSAETDSAQVVTESLSQSEKNIAATPSFPNPLSEAETDSAQVVTESLSQSEKNIAATPSFPNPLSEAETDSAQVVTESLSQSEKNIAATPSFPNPLSEKVPNTRPGYWVKNLIGNVGEPLYFLAISLMGEELALQVWEEVREMIAYALILQLPDLIGQLILKQQFSSFNVCQAEDALDINRYACYTIVGSDFLLWIAIASRIIGRFLASLLGITNRSRGS
ncbi:MAG: hypothetical protein KME47_09225 [Nodosilinea sp. WJT8-NPBG4]|jgi:hypothetical protein|nr:hypothetical protein [Nodosilinea sp. WJT8-NPBG4]